MQLILEVGRRTLFTIFAFALGLKLCGAATSAPWTLDETWRLALQRNERVLAAHFLISEAEIVRTAAAMWPNPQIGYSVGNLVLGPGYDQEQNIHPQFFDQTIHQVGLSQPIDVWGRHRAHVAAATQGIAEARLLVQDALRHAYYAVSSAFVAIVREQDERNLAQSSRQRYDKTLQLTRKRFESGDIAEAELRVIELESLKYANAEDDAELEWRLARQTLASLLALSDAQILPELLAPLPQMQSSADAGKSADELLQLALVRRPDLLACERAQRRAQSELVAEQRDAFVEPTLEVGYQRSHFQVSGDNPHSLVVGLNVPIPIFDRNQAEIARARLKVAQAGHAYDVLRIETAQQIAQAHSRTMRAEAILGRLEQGGMRHQAEVALGVAEKSYRAGAISYLEMLEAERTFIETQAHFISTVYDRWQARLDLRYATAFDCLGDKDL